MGDRHVKSIEGDLAASLLPFGVLLAACDVDGTGPRLVPASGGGESSEALNRIARCLPAIREGLPRCATIWANEREPAPQTVDGGIVLAPVTVHIQRRLVSWYAAVVFTGDVVADPRVATNLTDAGNDLNEARKLIRSLPPVEASEAVRTARMAAGIIRREMRRGADDRAIDDMGNRLAESYEELNLLYSTIRSMAVVDRPEGFVESACDDLLEVLPYQWVGAMFFDGADRAARVAGQFIAAGRPDLHAPEVVAAVSSLLEQVTADRGLVIETEPDDALAVLGRGVLVQPVVRDGQVLGIFVAGEKEPHGPASSSDIKLLGATAGHTAVFLENARLYDDVEAQAMGTLEALTAAIDAKDPYTSGHSQRVALLTEQLAAAAGCDPAFVGRARIAGLVHDVGKIGVAESVLTKPGRLTDEEFRIIQRHPEIGHRILRDIPGLDDILPGVLHHHERFDGRGYPHGLAGEDIPFIARLIALADSFDAMSSTRTYRARLGRQEVLNEIERGIGSQFDPNLAPLLLQLDLTPFDALVAEHSTGTNEQGMAA